MKEATVKWWIHCVSFPTLAKRLHSQFEPFGPITLRKSRRLPVYNQSSSQGLIQKIVGSVGRMYPLFGPHNVVILYKGSGAFLASCTTERLSKEWTGLHLWSCIHILIVWYMGLAEVQLYTVCVLFNTFKYEYTGWVSPFQIHTAWAETTRTNCCYLTSFGEDILLTGTEGAEKKGRPQLLQLSSGSSVTAQQWTADSDRLGNPSLIGPGL